METRSGEMIELVRTEVEGITFRPVNDEYRPFGFSICRELLHERVEVPLVVRIFSLPERKRILVVGCGTGSTLIKLAQFFAHPMRSRGRTLPLHLVPALRPYRFRLFWAAHKKV